MTKTASGLVSYCKAQLGRPYWYGTFGQKSSKTLYEQKKKQYPKFYTANDFDEQYGVKVHDCIGLIKGYVWSKTNNDPNPKYQSNGMPDINEAMMYEKAKVKGSISTMPKKEGICVLMKGHIGVYIGDGYVIEAKGHSYGVVKTKLAGRGWTKWCECPYIKYDVATETKPAEKKGYQGEFPSIPKNWSLHRNCIGDEVAKLQRFLNWYGNYKLDVDGDFGRKTESAVKKYQKAEKLQVDGRFGAKSLAQAKKVKK